MRLQYLLRQYHCNHPHNGRLSLLLEQCLYRVVSILKEKIMGLKCNKIEALRAVIRNACEEK